MRNGLDKSVQLYTYEKIWRQMKNKSMIFFSSLTSAALIFLSGCAAKQSAPSATNTSPTTQSTGQTGTSSYHDNIYLVKSDSAKGSYVTDFAGMTVYTFDKDSTGVSACNATCTQTWKPYSSGATAQKQFPDHITVIKRSDNSDQFAWDGKPLYYFAGDQNQGDIKGDGVGGVWHIIKM